LSTLLSQALVACTIELDDEFEHLMPHRTTSGGRTERHAPWLVSYVMWANCVRVLAEHDGIPVGELTRLAGTETNVDGMRRWGYVTVEPDPGDTRASPPRRDLVMRLTRAGRRAHEVWQPLPGVVEDRWAQRFGHVKDLTSALSDLVGRLDMGLPDCLPVLHYGLFSRVAGGPARPVGDLSLIALLSRATAAFALAYEADAAVSLAVAANVLRVLDERGVRVRDVPRLGGVSKESATMATGFLGKKQLVVIEPETPGGRTKVIRLTDGGMRAKAGYERRLAAVEDEWRTRLGDDIVAAVRASLERVRDGLFLGLSTYPDGWRASLRQPDTLPHFPMVTHRGGFPDGS
jgi:DNA-binding MarR family transcriptional regulator